MNNPPFESALQYMRTELLGSGLCKKYIHSIEQAQRHFTAWAAERGIVDMRLITKRNLYDYQQALLAIVSPETGKPLARGTLSDRYGAVKKLFSAACRAGLLDVNLSTGVQFELPKTEGLKRQAFSNEALDALFEHMDIRTKAGLRDRALFELMYSSGLRVSEASKLLVKDVCLQRREMIVRGKFGRDRAVPISKLARNYLALYLQDRVYNKEEPVFRRAHGGASRRGLEPESISRRFSDLLKKYGMKRKELSAHSIRHASASELLEHGAGIRQVQELLGHRNMETTVRYTHVGGEGLVKEYRKYHPQEHDLFEAVDDVYRKRLGLALGIMELQ
jgi:integrase/recombinase XerD